MTGWSPKGGSKYFTVKFSTPFRSAFIVLASVVALGLAACSSAPHSVDGPALQRGIDEPYFVQPERMAQKRAVIESGQRVDLVFIGDSITQNYEKPDYQSVWQKFYGHRHALNLGYGMDTTGATLWRFRQGELKGLAPTVTVILIGTNDTNVGRSSDDTFAGIVSVVGEVRARLPATQIMLIGILPSVRSDEKSKADMDVNARLSVYYKGDGRVTYLSVAKAFLEPLGVNRALYVEQSPEGALHPNPEGQAAMAKAIEPIIQRLLGE